ncbi:hypothetical protein Ddc_15136 [Ditylenchus destructor]|nr:hypothetical protein Ddc_15136 [Ditylenchus destructor]
MLYPITFLIREVTKVLLKITQLGSTHRPNSDSLQKINLRSSNTVSYSVPKSAHFTTPLFSTPLSRDPRYSETRTPHRLNRGSTLTLLINSSQRLNLQAIVNAQAVRLFRFPGSGSQEELCSESTTFLPYFRLSKPPRKGSIPFNEIYFLPIFLATYLKSDVDEIISILPEDSEYDIYISFAISSTKMVILAKKSIKIANKVVKQIAYSESSGIIL